MRAGRLEVARFYNDYENLTGACTVSGGCSGDQVGLQFNGGEVKVYGAEATAGWTVRLPIQLSIPLSASYAWTESAFQTGFDSSFPQFGTVEIGDHLPYVPVHQGHAGLALVHPRAELNLGLSARSGMLDAAGTFPIGDTDVPPLVLLDADAELTPPPTRAALLIPDHDSGVPALLAQPPGTASSKTS